MNIDIILEINIICILKQYGQLKLVSHVGATMQLLVDSPGVIFIQNHWLS